MTQLEFMCQLRFIKLSLVRLHLYKDTMQRSFSSTKSLFTITFDYYIGNYGCICALYIESTKNFLYHVNSDGTHPTLELNDPCQTL
jgi:hypothetical protein